MGTLHYFCNFFKSLKLFQNIKLKMSFRDFFPTGSHGDICMHMADSLWCTTETNTVL